MSTVVNETIPQLGWRKYLWILSVTVPLLGLHWPWLYLRTGNSAVLWSGVGIVFVLFPFLDELVGKSKTNPLPEHVPALEASYYFKVLVALFVPLQWAATVYSTWVAVVHTPSWWDLVGMVLTLFIMNGVAFNTAHELGHKKSAWEKWLAKIALAPTLYGHFVVEHNRGHHKNVATPIDPASSRLGESFWAFLPRTVIGSLRSAWALERERLQRQGVSVWHWHNENLQAWAISVVFFAAVTAWLGWEAFVFLLAQAAMSYTALEVINYVEHYGLLRQKDASGRYERCAPSHSWNSNHILSGLYLYQLPRHSDHHANPTRPYQALRHFEDAPQLPFGYAVMVILAYFPPLWRRVMDHRVVAHYGGDVRLANLHPPKADALIRRYAQSGD